MKILRPYQISAIQAMANSISQKKRPVGVVFVGGGKSLIISEIIRRILSKNRSRKVLMLVDSKELVQQNYLEFCDFVGLKASHLAGIYSAGLGKKDTNKPVMFASIQSYANYTEKSSHFDFIIIDECHLVPVADSSQYRRVLDIERRKNPNVACMGFTGTPWRMDMKHGTITDGSKGVFTDLACNIGCKQLIDEGYLSPIISYETDRLIEADLTGVKTRNGEFVESQSAKAFLRVLPAQVTEILEACKNRKKWLIFCQSKEHALAMFNALKLHISAAVVFGDSPDRDRIIDAYKKGQIRALINVKVLAKGFNCPDIDAVVLCFATQSLSNYIQKIGRGMRIAPGKKDTLVLDFGGNIARHGPIDQTPIRKEENNSSADKSPGVAPMKQCPECGYIVSLGQNKCDVCGYEFPEQFRNEGKNLTGKYQRGGILSSEPEMLKVELMVARNFVTKNKDACVVIDFYSSRQDRYPIHREFFNFWNKNQYAVKKSWEGFSLVVDPKLFYDVSESPIGFVNRLNSLIMEKTVATPSLIFLEGGDKGKFKKLVKVYY